MSAKVATKKVVKGKKVAQKKYTIDCSKAVDGEIFDVAAFVSII